MIILEYSPYNRRISRNANEVETHYHLCVGTIPASNAKKSVLFLVFIKRMQEKHRYPSYMKMQDSAEIRNEFRQGID